MYLVMLSTGEYSDRVEYQVGLVDSEEKAQGWVQYLEKIIKRVECAGVNKFHGAFDRPIGAPLDPNSNWVKYRNAVADASVEIKLIFGVDAPNFGDDTKAWLTFVPMLVDPIKEA